MIKAILKGTLIGGVLAFALSAVSWMMLPYHEQTLKHLKDEDSVRAVLKENAAEGGVYLLPCPEPQAPGATAEQKKAAMDAAHKKAAEGGNALIAYSPAKADPQMKLELARGLGIHLAGAFLMSLLLLTASGTGYIRRVLLVTFAAAAGAVMNQLPYWNWFYFSREFALVQILDQTAIWLASGIVMAALVPGKGK